MGHNNRLKQKTPLRSKVGLTRKKPINRMSKQKQKEKRETDALRAAYVAAADGICEKCGCDDEPLECHEITAGSSRHRAVYEPNTWLALCPTCHEGTQGMPFGYQRDVKTRAVNRAINRCLGRLELLE